MTPKEAAERMQRRILNDEPDINGAALDLMNAVLQSPAQATRLAELEAENACYVATRSFWPLSLREAIERRDLDAVRLETIRAEAVVKKWLEDSTRLAELERERDELKQRLALRTDLHDIDGKALMTVAAERDAAEKSLRHYIDLADAAQATVAMLREALVLSDGEHEHAFDCGSKGAQTYRDEQSKASPVTRCSECGCNMDAEKVIAAALSTPGSDWLASVIERERLDAGATFAAELEHALRGDENWLSTMVRARLASERRAALEEAAKVSLGGSCDSCGHIWCQAERAAAGRVMLLTGRPHEGHIEAALELSRLATEPRATEAKLVFKLPTDGSLGDPLFPSTRIALGLAKPCATCGGKGRVFVGVPREREAWSACPDCAKGPR